MSKGMLTSTGMRLIVLLVFFGVCTGLTWYDTTHSDCSSHIETSDAAHIDGEELVVKDLFPATVVAAAVFHYSPFVSPLAANQRNLSQSQFLLVSAIGRAPPA